MGTWYSKDSIWRDYEPGCIIVIYIEDNGQIRGFGPFKRLEKARQECAYLNKRPETYGFGKGRAKVVYTGALGPRSFVEEEESEAEESESSMTTESADKDGQNYNMPPDMYMERNNKKQNCA